MNRIHMAEILFAAVLLFPVAMPAQVLIGAAVAQSPAVLTPQQEEIAQHVDGMLMAPCCFANTVAEHRSPLSDKMREEVRALVASGATEKEILESFVDKYGERILAAPKQQGFNLFAYVLPWVALAAGLVAIGFILRRQRPSTVQPSAALPGPTTDQIKARFEAELARFDE
jgi:cytochrome c-type biogenesis protein CcmH/NrfF